LPSHQTSLDRFAVGAAYVAGRYVPIAKAGISVIDWGFTRSDNVHEVVHVFERGFFRLDDHLDQFMVAMQKRRLKPPEDRAAIEGILHRCVSLTGLVDAYVGMVALRGRPRVPGSRKLSDCDNHFVAYAIPLVDVIPKAVQERGAYVWIAETSSLTDPSHEPVLQCDQWFDLNSCLFSVQDDGYDTVVLCDEAGMTIEGPDFDLFVVANGRVSSPDRGRLHGSTRVSIFELCDAMGIEAAIEPIPREMLENADEIFLVTTAGGVMPVSQIGTRILGNLRPGPVSLLLKQAYWQRHREGWHRTPVRSMSQTKPGRVQSC
jgi:branched-chain amino acid aminotransferase